MKIYYTVSVRGNAVSKDTVRMHIRVMQEFGEVLTEHLGSDSEAVVDMGKTDEEIYEEDMKLLDKSDIVIADITNASLGVGFMIAKGIESKKQVLCLCKRELGKPLPTISAMIAGSPNVTIMFYHDEQTFRECITKFTKRKTHRIYLTGPPGSGKSTLGKYLASKFYIPYISTGELLRSLDPKSELGRKVNEYMSKGELVPSELMYGIVINALGDSFILDGYPPSYDDLQNLKRGGINPDLVIALICQDEKAIRRQCGRGERVTDTEEAAKRRLQVFHAMIPPIEVLRNDWFKGTPFVVIDANIDDPVVVQKHASDAYVNFFTGSRWSSYHPVARDPSVKPNSTRFHFHIDGARHESVVDLTKKLLAVESSYNGQIKIYPISQLQLGPQAKTDVTYQTMMNFHKIDEYKDSESEAFATGCMGETMSYNILLQLLNLATKCGEKYMIEVEQYLGEWTFQDGKLTNNVVYEEEKVDMSVFSEYQPFLNKKIPPFELHFGFDVPKAELQGMPIELGNLMDECSKAGFNNGGWFIFKDQKVWKYRSNEFSDLSFENAKSKLLDQAVRLDTILKIHGLSVPIGLSLEVVHGIWQF
jgi:adenylate kinase family enzyme